MSRVRNRITKAGFWTDGELLRWPRDKRFFYKSLWACAEDSCCLEDDMFEVKLTVWGSPCDSDMTVEMFEAWRDELIECGKVVPYTSGGKRYLYLPQMAEHEKPRNPQSPDLPLPAWVEYAASGSGKSRRVTYEHTYCGNREDSIQSDSGYREGSPVLSCPVLPCPDLSKDKPLSLGTSGVDPSVLGYWLDKVGREPKASDLRSLRVLCKTYSPGVVNLAIGQACAQGERADNFALITTIARAEVA